jgi:two-component system sensor histidine kinase QseC
MLLISKIENRQFEDIEDTNFSQIVNIQIELLKDFIEAKSLVVVKNIDNNFIIKANYFLSESLAINLLGNAVKHSTNEGNILVELANNSFKITNTGTDLNVPAEKLFERFYKINMASDSSGLGLSIVKKICEVSNWKITYKADSSLHIVTVTF